MVDRSLVFGRGILGAEGGKSRAPMPISDKIHQVECHYLPVQCDP